MKLFLAATGLLAVMATPHALVGQTGSTQDPTRPKAKEKEEGEQKDPETKPQTIIVRGRAENLVGVAGSASEGRVGQAELRKRPLLRVGEVLETVPGLIATQHSGAGKANQFFLRGFNLDHGTDLRTTVAGIPVNMPSHGHGQGYTDLNFMIPELIETVNFRKGPYAARDGDFGSAGAVDIHYVRSLERGVMRVEAGSYDWKRAIVADSLDLEAGTLLFAGEFIGSEGRWENPDDFHKLNGMVRFSRGDTRTGLLTLTGMAYEGDWTATDHIPERAVRNGTLGRFGTLDPTSGGATDRYTVSATWNRESSAGRTSVNAYGVYYEFELFSNFTYLLNDPVNGDQFEQTDRRWIGGLETQQDYFHDLFGNSSETSVGLQFRGDRIANGLHNNVRRARLSTVRQDDIEQYTFSLWGENKTEWTSWLRTTIGARVDHYRFDVESNNPANSGRDDSTVVSPRAGVALGPWADTEFYLNGGFGFHSNDARGVTLRDDPSTATPNDGTPVTALPRSKGGEIGIRTTALKGLQSTVSLWYLENDSELVFVGDAGTTEAAGGSERYGVELANFYQPLDWLSFDVDVAVSRAFFNMPDNGGRRVPNSVELTANAAATISYDRWLASLRMRHFGTRPLTEDNSARSDPTTLFNLRLGYQYSESAGFTLDVLNLFDEKDKDIQYFYESRLAGEPAAGVADYHFHPVEPFTLRFGFEAKF